MRSALGRARGLVAFLLLVLSAWWVLTRRRSRVAVWTEPAYPGEPGPPGELPADVLATDAGLTEVPSVVAPAPVPEPRDELATDAGLTDFPEPATPAASADLPAASADLPAAPADVLAAPAASTDLPGAPAASADRPAAPADLPGAPAASADLQAAPADFPAAPAAASADLPESTDGTAGRTVADPVAPGAAVIAPAPGTADADVTARIDAGSVGAAPVGAGWPVAEDGDRDGIDEATAVLPLPPREPVREPGRLLSEAPTMEIPAVTDDLRAVRGIGPSMERMLHGLGIVSFRQLALLDGADLERVREELRDFRSRIEREDWIGQAAALHKEKYGTDPA